jgi:hypothetical protein
VRLRHKGGRDEFFRAETETMADSWVIVGQRGTVGHSPCSTQRLVSTHVSIPRNVRLGARESVGARNT